MRTHRMHVWMVMGSLLCVASAWALPMGTAFNYQGFLEKPAGTPLTDTCDFRFYLIDAPMAGNIVGNSPQVATGVSVTSGNFSVEIDFGTSAFTGEGRWITIEVKCPGDGAYVLMTPAVELTPVPHALALPGLRTPETASVPNVIGGSPENTMTAGVEGGTIAGGGLISPSSQWNVVTGDGGAIGGGTGNDAAHFATVAGGYNNHANGMSSAVGGGEINFANGAHATVSGGTLNTAMATGSSIGGGMYNALGPTSDYSTISGGQNNLVHGKWATVPGGAGNIAGGDYSLAAGLAAYVREAAATGDADGDEGTFVWADSENAIFASTGANQFLIRAAGGVGVNTNAPSAALDVVGDLELNGALTVDASTLVVDAGTDRVGVGVAAPTERLDVAGNAKVSGSFTVDTSTLVVDNVNNRVGIGTASPGAALGVFGPSELNGTLWVDTTTLVVDATNDRVGIGVLSPTEKLDVAGNAKISGALMVDTSSLVVDAVNSRVGIGVVSPTANLDVVGSAKISSTLTVDTTTLVVDATNNRLGVGTTSPTSAVEIAAQDGLAITGFQPFLTLRDTNASNARARIANAGGSFSFFPESYIGGSAPVVITNTTGRVGIGDTAPSVALDVVGDIHYTGVITDVSDERLKEDIQPVESALDKVSRLRGVTFAMKGSSAAREAGLIAQDVKAVLPEAVRVVDLETGYLGVSYPSVTSLLVESIKEIRTELDATRTDETVATLIQTALAQLERRNAELEARLARLEAILQNTQTASTGDRK